ncbi:hypothetical protein [Streptococcus sp. E17BB]|uniref:hypothetical protein n=1 Tax=Streptococcus sp. E17BB TaxID=3278714 RepID=UPI00359DDEB6
MEIGVSTVDTITGSLITKFNQKITEMEKKLYYFRDISNVTMSQLPETEVEIRENLQEKMDSCHAIFSTILVRQNYNIFRKSNTDSMDITIYAEELVSLAEFIYICHAIQTLPI